MKIKDRIKLLDVKKLKVDSIFNNGDVVEITNLGHEYFQTYAGEKYKHPGVWIPILKDYYEIVDCNLYDTVNEMAIMERESKEEVNHPDHYGGNLNQYETIKVIEAWDLGFSLGNTIKYISRAGKKDNTKKIVDLQKAQWYLQREIKKLKENI